MALEYHCFAVDDATPIPIHGIAKQYPTLFNPTLDSAPHYPFRIQLSFPYPTILSASHPRFRIPLSCESRSDDILKPRAQARGHKTFKSESRSDDII